MGAALQKHDNAWELVFGVSPPLSTFQFDLSRRDRVEPSAEASRAPTADAADASKSASVCPMTP